MFSKQLYHVYPLFFIVIISSLFAWWIKFKISSKKSIYILSYSVLIVLLGLIGMPNWLNYTAHDDTLNIESFPEISLRDLEGNKNFNLKKGKVYVIDLWSTICAPCIEKFPDFEELMDEHHNKENVEFITLCLPIKDREFNYKFVKNYRFKSLYSPDYNSWEKLGIKGVPNYLVINKDLEVIYKGSLNDQWYHFYNNINSIIDDAYKK